MLKKLKFWILDVFEDFPLPYEIRYFYFALHRQGEYYYLSFGGCENLQKRLLNFDYYPLEAQFFDIYNLRKNFSLYDLKILIEHLQKDKKIKKLFTDLQIFIGVFGENKIYLV